MIFYFVSALLVSAVVYKLGAYVMLVSLIAMATKAVVALAVLTALLLLWSLYKGSWRSIRFIGRS